MRQWIARNFFRNAVLALLALLLAFAADARAVSIIWSPVGNPGNAADTTVMNDGTSGYGSVPYAFDIDKYDVTNSQYVEFLNAKSPDGRNPFAIYQEIMSDPMHGGINYNTNAPNGTKYSAMPGRENYPVIQVTWYDAARFTNWLNNGQGNADTESGSYSLLGGNHTVKRNASATIVIPNENEWHKAAFYDPRAPAQGGPPISSHHYWLYPTSSNTPPTASVPTGAINSANYNNVVGGPTAVGAYTGTRSPYGAFDMGSDAYQWNEPLVPSISWTPFRGGAYDTSVADLKSSYLNETVAELAYFDLGFRVALIPEPSSLALAAFGFAGLAAWGWRRRKR